MDQLVVEYIGGGQLPGDDPGPRNPSQPVFDEQRRVTLIIADRTTLGRRVMHPANTASSPWANTPSARAARRNPDDTVPLSPPQSLWLSWGGVGRRVRGPIGCGEKR
jgi:hypothetical protein